MTREDYELIADVLKSARSSRYVHVSQNDFVDADALAPTNPRFDAERFLIACGAGDTSTL